MAGFISCKNKPEKVLHAGHTAEQQYTCPMHTHVIKHKPGKCPVCGMDLVLRESNREMSIDSTMAALLKPVNAQVISSISTITPEKGTRIHSMEIQGTVTYDSRNKSSISSRVSGRIERLLIKYNYQPVQKGQLIMEIYSPDLAAAQQELLFISKTGNEDGMLVKAKERLQLLGMQSAQINEVIKTGKIVYRVPVYSNSSGYILEQTATTVTAIPTIMPAKPSSGGDGMNGMNGSSSTSTGNTSSLVPASSPVLLREGQYVSAGQSLFTVYQSNSLVAVFALQSELAAQVKKGQKILYYPTAEKNDIYTGTIGLIEPVFRNGQNFTLARVYVNKGQLQVGQLVTAHLSIVYNSGWWVPKKAVWRLGNKTIVFKREKNVFIPMEVKPGVDAKDMVQIMSNIDDWEIASNAYYLIDSESFIKTNNQAQQ